MFRGKSAMKLSICDAAVMCSVRVLSEIRRNYGAFVRSIHGP